MIFGEVIKLMTFGMCPLEIPKYNDLLEIALRYFKNHYPLIMAFGNITKPNPLTCIGLVKFGPIYHWTCQM